jgi:hypothetical protein
MGQHRAGRPAESHRQGAIGFDELDPRILPDMGVKVRFLDNAAASPATPSRSAVELPATAVFDADGKRYVWRVMDSTVERVAVSTGTQRDERIEILSGINTGDSVVLQPTAELQDGGKIKVKIKTDCRGAVRDRRKWIVQEPPSSTFRKGGSEPPLQPTTRSK